MKNQHYQIVFEGRVVPGVEVAKVQAKLAALFRCEPQRIEPLFSGQRRVLKKGLDLEAARDFQAAMQNAGALCEVMPMEAADAKPAAQGTADSSEAPPAAGPASPTGAGGAQPEPAAARPARLKRIKAQAAEVTEKVRALKKEDLQHKFDDLKDRIRQTDAEEAGRLVSAGMSAFAARLAAARGSSGFRGLWKSRGAKVLLIGAAAVAGMILFAIFHQNPAMPTDPATLGRFEAQFNQELRKIDLGRSRAITGVTIAGAVLADMGYDYNKTLRLWLLDPALRQGASGELLYARYLVGPLRDLTAISPQKAAELVDEPTLRIVQAQLEIPEGVTPNMLAMLQECPRAGSRLKHSDLLAVLQANHLPIDPQHPDLAIQQTFTPLARSGLIDMQNSGAWGKETMDIEIRDPDRIAKVAETFKFIETMRAEYLGGEAVSRKP